MNDPLCFSDDETLIWQCKLERMSADDICKAYGFSEEYLDHCLTRIYNILTQEGN